MESFFLSETTKYLCLLHSNATALPDYYIFSTEGHLLPVLPSAADAEAPEEVGAQADGVCKATKETEGSGTEVADGAGWEIDGAEEQSGTTALGLATGDKCRCPCFVMGYDKNSRCAHLNILWVSIKSRRCHRLVEDGRVTGTYT